MKQTAFLLACLFACDSADDPRSDGGVPDGGDSAIDASGDGGTPADEGPATLSPLACQADLDVFRQEDFATEVHPLDHKGEVYGVRAEGLVALRSGTLIAEEGQRVDGFDDLELAFDRTEIAVARDHGAQNEPAAPVAFTAFMRGDGGFTNNQAILLATNAGAVQKVVALGDAFVGLGRAGLVTGTVRSFSNLRVTPEGAVLYLLRLDEGPEFYLVRDDGETQTILLAQGETLADGFQLGEIGFFTVTEFSSPVVRAQIRSGDTLAGFAYLHLFWFGDVQCLATDTALPCGGIRVPAGTALQIDDFGSDGAATGVVDRTSGSNPVLRYSLLSGPGEITRGEETQGFTFNNFKQPRACTRDNSLYFVGTIIGDRGQTRDELMKLSEDGTLQQLTNFQGLLGVEELEGEVPDEILNLALGFRCDAVLRVRGATLPGSTAPYEGYWVSYADGDTIEILDETPGRPGNGNGPVMGLTRSRSGIDPNADARTPSNIGPQGEFNLLLQAASSGNASYARATRPADRCRTPSIVNTGDDADDVAPGDGMCDTGAMVGGEPACSFRAALQEANAAPGPDTIRFEAGLTIEPSAPLPVVSSTVAIEGDQTVVSGTGLSGDVVGLDVQARGVSLRGITLEGFPSHGLRADEDVELEDVVSRSNCGWGLWLERGAGIRGDQTRVENNGTADGCEAGGIFASNPSARLQLADAVVRSNGGAGVLSAARIQTTSLQIEDNEGDGLVVDRDGAERALWVTWSTLTVRGNRGHGLRTSGGGLATQNANLVVEDNCGCGLWLEDEIAILDTPMGRTPGPHSIVNNGLTSAEGGAIFWSIEGGQPTSRTGSCGGGGISLTGMAPDRASVSRIQNARIANNQGPGIASTGLWRLTGVTVSGNFGPGV
ncbi:MAG: right-handed parallel beta-helix repeat-containing protein, partial [Myxococcota bacterium]